VSTDYARVTYMLGRCKVSRFPVALYLDGEPPFSGCRRQRAETLASSHDGRVFERYRLESSGEFYPYVYGCLYGGAGGQVLLGRNYDEETIAHPVVIGRFAAYASVGCGIGACNSAIVSQPLDLSGPPGAAAAVGARRRLPVERGRVDRPEAERLARVARPALGRRAGAGARPGTRGLRRRPPRLAPDRHGPRDRGGSLTLDPATSVISWVNAGITKSALLD
jgi:hypothetical protein